MLRFGLGLAGIVFILDQVSKYLILGPLAFSPPGCFEAQMAHLEGAGACGRIALLPFFELRMVWNPGVSFGMLRADSEFGRWALVAVQLAIAAVFAFQLPGAQRRLTMISLGLIIGGAIGNVVDRIRFGAVADFLDFSGLWFPWVFNVADAAISVGAALFFIDIIFIAETEPGAGTMWQAFEQRALALLGVRPPPGAHAKEGLKDSKARRAGGGAPNNGHDRG